jgi:hypothetical protein
LQERGVLLDGELHEHGVAFGIEPGDKGFEFGLRHGGATHGTFSGALPDVKEDAGAAAGGGVGIGIGGGDSCIVVDDDAPAIRFSNASHVLGAVPVGG